MLQQLTVSFDERGVSINKRTTGGGYENIAAAYLIKNRVTILEMNFRCKTGEIDIIGRDDDYLVFFEVKYRNSLQMGSPKEAVDYRKMKKICRVSDYYRLIHHLDESTPIRYDVISIKGEEIEWVRNAFDYM